MAHWRWATEEENKQIRELPDAQEVGTLGPLQFLSVVRGTVLSREGEEIKVPEGRVAVTLDEEKADPWCYRVKELIVEINGQEASLREGTLVAIFAKVRLPENLFSKP